MFGFIFDGNDLNAVYVSEMSPGTILIYSLKTNMIIAQLNRNNYRNSEYCEYFEKYLKDNNLDIDKIGGLPWPFT